MSKRPGDVERTTDARLEIAYGWGTDRLAAAMAPRGRVATVGGLGWKVDE